LRVDRALLAQGGRFAAVGAFITVVYVCVTASVRFTGASWWLAIAVGYAVATSTHFVLHRTVVFRREEGFQLTLRQQLPRFVAVVVCQYAVTAVAMEYLPGLWGLPELFVFVCVAGFVTVVSFLLLRTKLFH
jgi:putative flippase GtrA